VVDTINGRPRYTPTLLGTALFRHSEGLAAPARLPISLDKMLMFTWVHGLAFAMVGGAASWLLSVAERRPSVGFGILMLFVVFEFGFIAAAWVFVEPVLQTLAWPAVLVANLLAAATMGGYFACGIHTCGSARSSRHQVRPSRSSVAALAIGLGLSVGAAAAHEGHDHPMPDAIAAIDPSRTYPYGLVAAGGGHFHALVVMPGMTTVFAGTHIGLFRSNDLGLTWRLAAPRFSGDDVHAIARDPLTGVLYVASHRQGLLVSRDDGASWHDDSLGLPGRDLHALALDSRRARGVYVWAVGHGLLYRAAETRRWQTLAGGAALADVESLATNPEEAWRLYAGTASGVWVSTDHGRHWQRPKAGLHSRTNGVTVAPPWPDRVFAASLDGVFVGRADGTGWQPLPPSPAFWGPIDGFAFLKGRPELMFGVAHDGVVAVRALKDGEWTPLALAEKRGF
jgi:hypothetical protein